MKNGSAEKQNNHSSKKLYSADCRSCPVDSGEKLIYFPLNITITVKLESIIPMVYVLASSTVSSSVM